MAKTTAMDKWVGYGVLSIPAIVYFAIVCQYAVNIPSQDDYGATLDFLCQYKLAHGTDKIWLLFSQHNEHRILSSRIVYVLYNQLSGTINFRHIIILANLQLLLVFVVTVALIRQ